MQTHGDTESYTFDVTMQAENLTDGEKTFAARLLALRKSRKMTQAEMGEHLAISKGYIWQLEDGRKQPSADLLKAVEMMEQMPALGADRPRVTGDIMHGVKFEPLRYIPVISWAQAGVSVDFEELPKDWQDRIPTNVKDPKAVALEIRGDSMEPYIRAGDRVILLPSQDPQNGDIVVAKFKDNGIALKLYHEREDGRVVHLASYNTLYPPQEYSRDAFEWIIPCDSLQKKLRH